MLKELIYTFPFVGVHPRRKWHAIYFLLSLQMVSDFWDLKVSKFNKIPKEWLGPSSHLDALVTCFPTWRMSLSLPQVETSEADRSWVCPLQVYSVALPSCPPCFCVLHLWATGAPQAQIGGPSPPLPRLLFLESSCSLLGIKELDLVWGTWIHARCLNGRCDSPAALWSLLQKKKV